MTMPTLDAKKIHQNIFRRKTNVAKYQDEWQRLVNVALEALTDLSTIQDSCSEAFDAVCASNPYPDPSVGDVASEVLSWAKWDDYLTLLEGVTDIDIRQSIDMLEEAAEVVIPKVGSYTYEIQTLYGDQWTNELGESAVYATETAAKRAIEELRALGPDWAGASYRVIETWSYDGSTGTT
jgi:hypothetical protein